MRKILKKFLSVFAVAVLMQFSAAGSRADIPMAQFADSLNIGVSADTTFQYVFGCDTENAPDCPGERGLYSEHNDFSIDAFTVSLSKDPDPAGASFMDKVGFRTDILFGEQAERLGFGFNSGGDGAVSPYQAYIHIAPSERFSIYAGQFTTLAGWELIEAKDNTNISRSLLFYRIPFAHSGARFSYNAGPVDLTLGISNDWDATDEVNDGKTFEFQAAYSHSSDMGLINDLWVGLTAYVGKSEFLKLGIEDEEVLMVDGSGEITRRSSIGYKPDGGYYEEDSIEKVFRGFELAYPAVSDIAADNNKTRTLITLVGSVTSGKFTFVGDAEFTWVSDGVVKGTYTMGDDPRTTGSTENEPILTGIKYDTFFRWGFGGYAVYELTPDTKVALRGEYVDDGDAGATLYEFTPTVMWRPFGSSEMGTLETRLEYRWDRADEPYFPSDSGLEKDQHALLFQLLYWI